MQEIADVYARSLFEVARENDSLDEIKEQLDEFADALEESRELRTYFFSPYFSSHEKIDGIDKVLEDADERFVRFLSLLAERHRLPVIHRIRREFDDLYGEERQLINVKITSAVELDEAVAQRIGEEIGRQTGRRVQLSSRVDPDVLGGIVVRVGNSILDASIRTRLERLRKQVART